MRKISNVALVIVISLTISCGGLIVAMGFLSRANPYLKSHQDQVVNAISGILKQPVTFSSAEVGHIGFEPVLKLYDFAVLSNESGASKIKIRELDLGISLLKSLVRWRIIPGSIIVNQGSLTLCQPGANDKKASIKGQVSRCGTSSTSSSLVAEMSGLKKIFEATEIIVIDSNVTWQFNDGANWNFTHLNIAFTGDIYHRNLFLHGSFEQKKQPTNFSAELSFNGDFLDYAALKVKGKVELQNNEANMDLQSKSNVALQSLLPGSGKVSISAKKQSIMMPQLWQAPLVFNEIGGVLRWQHSEDNLRIEVNRFKLRDNYLNMGGSISLLFSPSKNMPDADARINFTLHNVAKAKKYVPNTVLSPGSSQWLKQAFVSGNSIKGDMILQGNLHDFPFDKGRGKFVIDTDVSDIVFNYQNGWPLLKNAYGNVLFSGKSMHIKVKQANAYSGMPLFNSRADIADLNNPIVKVSTEIETSTDTAMRFLRVSPLRAGLAKQLGNFKLAGSIKLALQLAIPLDVKGEILHYSGNLFLSDNTVVLRADDIKLENLQGQIQFDEKQVTGNGLRAKFLDQFVNLNIATLNPLHGNSVIAITTQSAITVKNLEKILSVSLTPYVSGAIAYKVKLQLLKDKGMFDHLLFTSDLKDTQINLPEPFGKNLGAIEPLAVLIKLPTEDKLQVFGNAGSKLNAYLQFNKAIAKTWEFTGGTINLGKGSARSTHVPSGIAITGSLDRLSLADWQEILAKSAATKNFSILRKITLQVHNFIMSGFAHALQSVKLDINLNKGGSWTAAISNADIDGKISAPSDLKIGAMNCVFKKLHFNTEGKQPSKLQPKDVPRLHFVADNVSYNGKFLGKVTFNLLPQGDNRVLVNDINVSNPNLALVANGKWSATGAGQQFSSVVGKLQSNDFGSMLRQMLITSSVDKGKGTVNFSLDWSDSIMNSSLRNIRGMLALKISNGSILNLGSKAESQIGFGKVISLLSLQNLPLHLISGFGDVSGKGLSFDTLTADLQIQNGSVFTKDIKLNGPLVAVEVKGRIGFSNKDYDMILRVTNKVSTGLPALAGFAGGPVVGITALVAEKILGGVVQQVASSSYHVTGSWDNPKFGNV